MAHVRCNGLPVSELRLTLPRMGVWHADAVLAGGTRLTGSVVIEVGSVAFRGTIRRSGSPSGTGVLRVVGGAGGMGELVEARQYRQAKASIIVEDVLRASGEVLSPIADATILTRVLPVWVAMSASAATTLSAVLTEIGEGLAWRILPDGSLWLGEEPWPKAEGIAALVLDDPLADRVVLAAPSPSIFPGTTISGRRISYVEHRVTPEAFRSSVWLEAA